VPQVRDAARRTSPVPRRGLIYRGDIFLFIMARGVRLYKGISAQKAVPAVFFGWSLHFFLV